MIPVHDKNKTELSVGDHIVIYTKSSKVIATIERMYNINNTMVVRRIDNGKRRSVKGHKVRKIEPEDML